MKIKNATNEIVSKRRSTNRLQVKNWNNMNIAKYFSNFVHSVCDKTAELLSEDSWRKEIFQSSNFRPIFKKSLLFLDLKHFHDRDPALQIVRNRLVTSVLLHVDRMIEWSRDLRVVSLGYFQVRARPLLNKGKIVSPSKRNKNLTIRWAAFDWLIGGKNSDIPLVYHVCSYSGVFCQNILHAEGGSKFQEKWKMNLMTSCFWCLKQFYYPRLIINSWYKY